MNDNHRKGETGLFAAEQWRSIVEYLSTHLN